MTDHPFKRPIIIVLLLSTVLLFSGPHAPEIVKVELLFCALNQSNRIELILISNFNLKPVFINLCDTVLKFLSFSNFNNFLVSKTLKTFNCVIFIKKLRNTVLNHNFSSMCNRNFAWKWAQPRPNGPEEKVYSPLPQSLNYNLMSFHLARKFFTLIYSQKNF